MKESKDNISLVSLKANLNLFSKSNNLSSQFYTNEEKPSSGNYNEPKSPEPSLFGEKKVENKSMMTFKKKQPTEDKEKGEEFLKNPGVNERI